MLKSHLSRKINHGVEQKAVFKLNYESQASDQTVILLSKQ